MQEVVTEVRPDSDPMSSLSLTESTRWFKRRSRRGEKEIILEDKLAPFVASAASMIAIQESLPGKNRAFHQRWDSLRRMMLRYVNNAQNTRTYRPSIFRSK